MKVRLKRSYPQKESAMIVLEKDFEVTLLHDIIMAAVESNFLDPDNPDGMDQATFAELLLEELKGG